MINQNQTRPHLMTTAERLDEIASILAKAIVRVQKREEISSSGESFTGLHCKPKHACNKQKKRREHDKNGFEATE